MERGGVAPLDYDLAYGYTDHGQLGTITTDYDAGSPRRFTPEPTKGHTIYATLGLVGRNESVVVNRKAKEYAKHMGKRAVDYYNWLVDQYSYECK